MEDLVSTLSFPFFSLEERILQHGFKFNDGNWKRCDGPKQSHSNIKTMKLPIIECTIVIISMTPNLCMNTFSANNIIIAADRVWGSTYKSISGALLIVM